MLIFVLETCIFAHHCLTPSTLSLLIRTLSLQETGPMLHNVPQHPAKVTWKGHELPGVTRKECHLAHLIDPNPLSTRRLWLLNSAH